MLGLAADVRGGEGATAALLRLSGFCCSPPYTIRPVRVGYSTGEGGDLRRDRDNWRYWQVYAEANRYLETNQTLASAEARFGHSFRLDAISPNMVLTPFVAAGAAYDFHARRTLRLWGGTGHQSALLVP